MRLLAFVVLVAMSVPALGQNYSGAASGQPSASASQASPNGAGYVRSNGRWWYHAANGAWFVWTAQGRWQQAPAEVAPTNNTAAAPGPSTTRVWTYYPPTVLTSYPDDDSRNVYFGIDWYTNGRGPFSD